MLALTVIIFCVLIFPLFINVNISYEKNYGKIYYRISAFCFIKILKGYVERIDEGIVVHLSRKKAVLILYGKIFGMRKKVKPLKDYHLIKFQSVFEIGLKNGSLNALSIGFIYNFILEYLSWFLYHKKPYFDFDNKVNVYEDKDKFAFSCKATILLNLLMILVSVIKIILGKLYYAIRNRIQQNQQSN